MAWGNLRFQSGSGSSRLGSTGEWQDGNLVYLRARWYHTGLGTFTTRDSYPGTPERSASLHRYLYTEGNPVNWNDPSGMCVAGFDRNCEAISWEDFWAGRWNWDDGQTYWSGVEQTAYDMTIGNVELLYNAATNKDTQAQMGRGWQALRHDFGGSGVIVGDAALTPFKAIAHGLVCRDSNQLGRGLTATFFILRGMRKSAKPPMQPARLTGSHGRAWWEDNKAKILEETTLQQTKSYNCGATCLRIIGLPEKIAQELEKLAHKKDGVNLEETSDLLRKYGIQHTLSEPYIPLREAMPAMQEALSRNERVLARVEGHMVVVQSIEKVGSGPRDYRIKVADPDTGHIIELNEEAWSASTMGGNTYIAIP